MQHSILDSIGRTPLVKLQSLETQYSEIYVKLENKNPGGSIKDRIALHMVNEALKEGRLTQEGVIIEPTSGNTGIALAMIAAVKGLQCIIVMPENMSKERQLLIQAYGAQLILTPAAEGMAGAVRRGEELTQANPQAFMPLQFSNVHAVQAHYLTTGPEIIEDFNTLGCSVDALVAGFGTGSCVSGTGLYLKEKNPSLQVFGVEPSESPLLSEGKSGPHGIQGIGANFIPSILRVDILDEVLTVRTEDALQTARALFRQEGISCGISSGANVFAAMQLCARAHMRGKRIVTFICDTGERYLSTKLFEI